MRLRKTPKTIKKLVRVVYSVCVCYDLILTYFFVSFSMVLNTRGLGSSDPERSGSNDDEIRRIIATKMTTMMKEVIMKMFVSIKIMLIKKFRRALRDCH